MRVLWVMERVLLPIRQNSVLTSYFDKFKPIKTGLAQFRVLIEHLTVQSRTPHSRAVVPHLKKVNAQAKSAIAHIAFLPTLRLII